MCVFLQIVQYGLYYLNTNIFHSEDEAEEWFVDLNIKNDHTKPIATVQS